jgi:hypothetical protein
MVATIRHPAGRLAGGWISIEGDQRLADDRCFADEMGSVVCGLVAALWRRCCEFSPRLELGSAASVGAPSMLRLVI